MNKYTALKEKHQAEINAFPMFFAFSDKQFAEGMAKLGLTADDTDKIYRLGNTGGFYLKSDSQKLSDMLDRHSTEREDAIYNDDEFVYQMFFYELANHEYCITYDYEPTLDACGLTEDDINNSERLARLLIKAKNDYMEKYD